MKTFSIISKGMFSRFFSVKKQPYFEDVKEVILKLVWDSPKFEAKNFKEDLPFENYGFDSLDQVELIVAFEEHLGFDIPNEDAENNIRTFDDAVYIFSKEL